MQKASEDQIRKIVEEVVGRVVSSGGSPGRNSSGDNGVFSGIDASVAAAITAQQALVAMTIEQRGKIIDAIRTVSYTHLTLPTNREV